MNWCRVVGGLVAVTCLIGCAREEPGGVVSGRVIYKGKALEKGTVAFQPASGVGELCHGDIQKDGKYKLKNQTSGEIVPVGQYVATVLVDNATVAVMQEDPMLLAKTKAEIPIKFSSVTTSPLKYEVKLGTNEFEIDLDKFSE